MGLLFQYTNSRLLKTTLQRLDRTNHVYQPCAQQLQQKAQAAVLQQKKSPK